MLNKLVQNYILSSILGSLKGKKRWLLIVVLVVANILQSQGVDLADFVVAVTEMLDNAEG